MRGSATVRLVVAAAIITWILYTQLGRRSDTASRVREAVQSYYQGAQEMVDQYELAVRQKVEAEISLLFQHLDSNADGCIHRDEFKGNAVLALTAARSVPLPQLPRFSFPEAPRSFFELATLVLEVQLLVLIGLFVVEHGRTLLFGGRPTLDTSPEVFTRVPPHADKSVALHYDTPSTPYETAKWFFFLFSGLLVVRIVVIVISFVIAVLFINLSVAGGRTRTKNPWWFFVWRSVATFWCSMMMAAFGFYQVIQTGSVAGRDKVKLLIGNHVCTMELPLLFFNAALPSFVTAVENLSMVPLFRGMCVACEAIVVDRSRADSRHATLAEIMRRSRDKDGAQLMLFPEGTCGNQLAMFKFKRGAFEAGEPVQMIVTKFHYKHFNPAWTGKACGGNDLQPLLLRLLSQFVNRVEVACLPVYHPTEQERADPDLYAHHCQQIIANVLGIPTSDASFEDYKEKAAAFYKKNKVTTAASVSPSITPRTTPEPSHLEPPMKSKKDD